MVAPKPGGRRHTPILPARRAAVRVVAKDVPAEAEQPAVDLRLATVGEGLENDAALLAELERLRPAEIILPAEANSLRDFLRDAFKILNFYEGWVFAPETALYTVREHFKVASLDGFGLKDRAAALQTPLGRVIRSPP